MIVDTSALVAIVFDEPEAERLAEAIRTAPAVRVPAPTLVEATAVLLGRLGERGAAKLRAVLSEGSAEVVPMTPEAAEAACDAYARHGKGVGAPGVLNFGDCLAYGVAKTLGEPLPLRNQHAKGADFTATDVAAAPY